MTIRNITFMNRELGQMPDRDAVVASYIERCAAALGVEIVPGQLSADEESLAVELDARFVTDE